MKQVSLLLAIVVAFAIGFVVRGSLDGTSRGTPRAAAPAADRFVRSHSVTAALAWRTAPAILSRTTCVHFRQPTFAGCRAWPGSPIV